VSTLAESSPELKRLWVRVLKRVHPDLAVDEQDRYRCEHLTQQANEAYARGDMIGLKAVLKLNTLPPIEPDDRVHVNTEPSYAPAGQASQAARSPHSVSRGEEAGILGAAGLVLCLLFYGILSALRQEMGKGASLLLLVIVTAAVLWWITLKSSLAESHKMSWASGTAVGMVLAALGLIYTHPPVNSILTAHGIANSGTAAVLLPSKSTVSHVVAPAPAEPKPETVERPVRGPVTNSANQLAGYLTAAKGKVADNWDPSEVVGVPPGATVYIQFLVWPRGNHDVPMTETSSGYPSLDGSCLRAVERIKTFGHLPAGYTGTNMTVFYQCTYQGPKTGKAAH
jgi:hypothetical protein